MTTYYFVVLPASRSKEVAEDILDHIKCEGWSAYIEERDIE